MKKTLLIHALFILLACSGEQKSSSDPADQPVIFHYNQPNNISSLDPAFARAQNNIWAVDHLYNGLVQLDEQLNVQPCIAKAWEISDDGKTYTFSLRNDVFFHDHEVFEGRKGRRVVAADFVYSFNRILDENVGSPGSWIFNGRSRSINPFEAPNDSSFVLHLNAPFRPMLGILTMQYCSVVPRELIKKYGKAFRSNPIGTGPFKLRRWIENQTLVLAKNENYFEKDQQGQALPYLDGIRVSFIGDRKTAYLELMKGKLDFMSGLESSYVDELLTKDGNLQSELMEKIQFLKSPYLNTEYLGILQTEKRSPLHNKKVRQALNYGFDRRVMMRSLRNNIGSPAQSGFTPKGLPSFDAEKLKGYNYDVDKARALLREAGYPNGVGLPELSLLVNSDYVDLCTFITRQWEELGVKVKIELMESATLRKQMSEGKAPFFRASWIADYPDAESFYTMFYSKNPAPPNYTRFKNQEFDRLYELALLENDDQKRYEFYQEMDAILIEEAPVIFLFYDETALFAQKNISGLSKNAINLLSLKKVKKF